MRKLIQGKLFQSRQFVTVCWLDEEVTFALWLPEGSKGPVCRKLARRAARRCDAQGYLEALRDLVPSGRLRGVSVRWVVLKEAFPGMPGDAGKVGGGSLNLPAWMRQCWQELPVRHLPEQLISGMAVVEAALLDWSEFTEPGTGVLMSLDGRLLLIGHGNGRSFRRVSRRDFLDTAQPETMTKDWLLQTRSLFRNRTGMELKYVFVTDETAIRASSGAEFPISIKRGVQPPILQSEDRAFLRSACRYLHASAAKGRITARFVLTLPEMDQRKRWRRWEIRLQRATCALLAGWGFMLLGACRHEALVPVFNDEGFAELGRYKAELAGHQERWQRAWSERQSKERPFALISAIARSVPEGVKVNRFRVGPGRGPGPRQSTISLEGTFTGETASAAFRQWIDDLRNAYAVREVDNLRLSRTADHIAFSLEGIADGKGSER